MGKVFVAGEVPLDYNDEYYAPAGDQCDGGIIPKRVFHDENDAKQWCIGSILAEVNTGSWRVGSNVGYDATYQARWKWHYEQKGEPTVEYGRDVYYDPYTVYGETFDFDALLRWCAANGKDAWDYLPRVYDYMPAESD